MAMTYEEKIKKQGLPHNLSLSERHKLTLSGVDDVESFDEAAITLYTSGGLLLVRGSGLKNRKTQHRRRGAHRRRQDRQP